MQLSEPESFQLSTPGWQGGEAISNAYLYGGLTEDWYVMDGSPEEVEVTQVGQDQPPRHHLLHHPVGGLQSPQAGLQQSRDVVHQQDLLDLLAEGGGDADRVLLDVVDDGGVGEAVLVLPPPETAWPAPAEEKEGEDEDQEEEGGPADEGEDDDDAGVAEGDVREGENHRTCRVERQRAATAWCSCNSSHVSSLALVAADNYPGELSLSSLQHSNFSLIWQKTLRLN